MGPSEDGRHFLLLTERIFGRPLTERDSHLLPQALAALRSVHAAGLCHGDVRLPNFMVSNTPSARHPRSTNLEAPVGD